MNDAFGGQMAASWDEILQSIFRPRRRVWQRVEMEITRPHPELEADRRADRKTWLYFTIFVFAAFLVNALSAQDEIMRQGGSHPALPWLSEATSHLVILALVPFITQMLSRFPLFAGQWRANLIRHAFAVVFFSIVHILLMVGLRKLFMPILFGFRYDFGLSDPSVWLYEFRKDALSYATIAAIFGLSRMVEQKSLEAEAARAEAQDRHRLTLKSGGRTYFVDAENVIWAKAASNYVEVVTPARTYLARMTLTELGRLLEAAGGRHARVHRSHIVNLDMVKEIVPTGEGDVVLRLETGDEVSGSRRYRKAFETTFA